MFFTKHNELVDENCRLKLRISALNTTLEQVNHDKCMAMIELRGYKERNAELEKRCETLEQMLKHITGQLDVDELERIIANK
jgi:dynactin complex subunit